MKNIIGLITIIALVLISTKTVYAADTNRIAGNSASIAHPTLIAGLADRQDLVLKRRVIKSILERYNSPLVSEVDTFIYAAQKYNLDPYLLPSITGVESYFGQMIMQGTYNPFGWGGGTIYFTDWDNGIMTVAEGLHDNYYGHGAQTIYDVGRTYAGSTTWPAKVIAFMNQFNAEENNLKSVNLPL